MTHSLNVTTGLKRLSNFTFPRSIFIVRYLYYCHCLLVLVSVELPEANISNQIVSKKTVKLQFLACDYIYIYIYIYGARGSARVKALCYKPEDHGFDTR
jgi:hypothetical protein